MMTTAHGAGHAPPAVHHLPGTQLHNEVMHFFHAEAELLDNARYSEWFALKFADKDVRYWMPVRTTRFLAAGKGFDDYMALIDDNYLSLKTRTLRLEVSTWRGRRARRRARAISSPI